MKQYMTQVMRMIQNQKSEDEYRLDPYSFWAKLRRRDLNATIQELWESQIEDIGVSVQMLFAEKVYIYIYKVT